MRLGDGRFFIAGEIVTERTPGGVPSKVDLGRGLPHPRRPARLHRERRYRRWRALYSSTSDATTAASGVALTPDGKILVVPTVSESTNSHRLGLARFLPDGRLDTTFGSRGTWVAALPSNAP